MREIKFRQAIFVDGVFNDWHYWGYIDNAFVRPLNPLKLNRNYELKPDLQYTGLFDKQGKEIYEGDIVLCPEWGDYDEGTMIQVRREVRWDNRDACFVAFLKEESEWDGYLLDNNTNMEVIGNIYENPELLND